MRAVLGFFSMLALGLMIAAIMVVSATGVINNSGRMAEGGAYLDYVSVVIGLGVGLAIAILAQIPWGEIPRRTAQWIVVHAKRLHLMAWATLFVAVLVYF
jgi:hypothetical protein